MTMFPFPSTAIDRARFQIFCWDGGAANGTSSCLRSAVSEKPQVSDAMIATIQHAYLFTGVSLLFLCGCCLFEGLQVDQVVIFLMTGGLQQFEIFFLLVERYRY